MKIKGKWICPENEKHGTLSMKNWTYLDLVDRGNPVCNENTKNGICDTEMNFVQPGDVLLVIDKKKGKKS